METFRPVPGWPNYEVSDQGRVRSIRRIVAHGLATSTTPRLLKPRVMSNGYCMVTLSNRTKLWQVGIHRLVLLAFVGEPQKGQVACHYPDPDKKNNGLANLKWAYQWENESHKADQGSQQKRLSLDQVATIRNLLADGLSHVEIAGRFDVDPSLISKIRHGVHWSAFI